MYILFQSSCWTISSINYLPFICSAFGYNIVSISLQWQIVAIHVPSMPLCWFYASGSEFLLCYFFSFFTEHSGLISYTNHFRQQYAAWKTECQNIVPIIGSGKFITAAIVTDDGQSLQDSNRDPQDLGWHVNTAISDKKVLQWMLGLHQIGTYVVYNFILYWICIPFYFLPFKVAFQLLTACTPSKWSVDVLSLTKWKQAV